MKKFILLMVSVICGLGLISCSGKVGEADIVSIMEISGLVTEKGYTEEDFQEELLGKDRDNIVAAWGEPDGFLSGFWGDIWYLSDEGRKQLILYYDGDGIVEHVKIAEAKR